MNQFDINVEAKIVAKKSPDYEDVQLKAMAASAEVLIERNTIGQYNEEQEESDETDI